MLMKRLCNVIFTRRLLTKKTWPRGNSLLSGELIMCTLGDDQLQMNNQL